MNIQWQRERCSGSQLLAAWPCSGAAKVAQLWRFGHAALAMMQRYERVEDEGAHSEFL